MCDVFLVRKGPVHSPIRGGPREETETQAIALPPLNTCAACREDKKSEKGNPKGYI